MPRATVDTRAEIRNAALALFAERGFEQTSLREVAERIGVTKAALYYHYPSKDDLLAALVDPLIADLDDLTERITAAPPEAGALRAAVEGFFEVCLTHQLMLRGLMRDIRVLRRIDIVRRMLEGRDRLDAAIVGSGEPRDRVRAVVALGGVQDVVALYDTDRLDELRAPTIDAAMRALRAP